MGEFDLTPYLYGFDDRPDLKLPMTQGEHTYATNGHIAVRVPKRDGAPVAIRDIARLFRIAPEMTPATIAPLGGTLTVICDCDDCDGTGRAHKCRDCRCRCSHCNGTGKAPATAHRIGLRGAAFDISYVRMLAALPGLHLPVEAAKDAPMYFRFDGGEGVLMPVRCDGPVFPAEPPTPTPLEERG